MIVIIFCSDSCCLLCVIMLLMKVLVSVVVFVYLLICVGILFRFLVIVCIWCL